MPNLFPNNKASASCCNSECCNVYKGHWRRRRRRRLLLLFMKLSLRCFVEGHSTYTKQYSRQRRRAAFFLGCLRQGQSDSAEFTTAIAAAVEKTHRERRPPSNVLCYQRTTKTKNQGLSIEENQLLPRTHVRGFAPPLLKAGGYTTTDTFTNFFYHVLVHTRRHQY